MKIIYYSGLSMDGSGQRCGLTVLPCRSIAPGRDGNLLVSTEESYEVIPLVNVLRIVNDGLDTSMLENLPDFTKEGWKTI